MSDPARVEDVLTLDAEAIGPLTAPIMLVGLTGWFDVGGVATTALEQLDPDDRAVTVAEIDADPFYDFTQERPMVEITDGDIRRIVWPSNAVRVIRTGGAHDLVVLSGVEPHLAWATYVECVRRVVDGLRCEAVVTVGASADAVPHSRLPLVVGSTADAELGRRLALSAPSYQGITGLLGVLNAELDHGGDGRRIPIISLRVGVPHYLGHAEHPLAVTALLRHLAHVLGLTVHVDLTDQIERWASLHNEAVDEDAQLRAYVTMLEADYDRRAAAALASASGEDLAARFEEYLRDQRDDDG